jgi:hypothetical protein
MEIANIILENAKILKCWQELKSNKANTYNLLIFWLFLCFANGYASD